MPAFRILDQKPVYFDLQGKLAAGGNLHFYAAGTTTDANVYGDQALTVNNGSTIAIGSDGRSVPDIWGSGSYRVRLYAADGTLVDDQDNVEIPGGTGTAIPALVAGKVLSNDGAVLLWESLLAVPDPTGQSGKVLGSDGTSAIWQAGPTSPTLPPLPTGGVASTATSISAGKTTIQTGTGTFTATGAQGASATVTFPTAMASCSHVGIQMAGGTMFLHARVNTKNGTGFTAQCDSNIFGQNITIDQPFTYLAFGVLA